jgi:hypothetical protein
LEGFGCREGLGLVGAFHKHKETFWATLERHRRRETAPSLAKKRLCCNATEEVHRTRLATCFLLIAASILAARKLAQYDGGKRVPATVSAIADAIRWAEEIMAEIDRRWPANK